MRWIDWLIEMSEIGQARGCEMFHCDAVLLENHRVADETDPSRKF
jgi:hypothetical protein